MFITIQILSTNCLIKFLFLQGSRDLPVRFAHVRDRCVAQLLSASPTVLLYQSFQKLLS